MGMAASQARFLGLTARQNNVEFEGQQINQQRTALANQSANYYNNLLGMTVPTPPSVDSFTKTVYSFDDGGLTNTITSLIAQTNGNYSVSYLSQWEDDFAPVSNGSVIVTKSTVNSKDTYYVGNVALRTMDKNATTVTADPNDPYLSTLSTDQLKKLATEEKSYIALLESKYGPTTNGWMVRYVQNTSTGTWSPVFYKKDDVTGASYSSNGTSQSNISSYKMGSATRNEEVKGVTAKLEKDSTGRYINITLNAGSNNAVTYSLTTNTITDQDAYDDAMNQYEYEKYQYDQAIQEINAKIEVIQAEDKNLELRLKQLDTEQNAISTEKDSVEKIIEKNVETTFKSFA